MVSTPTTKGLSRIEAEWERSDQRRYHVACAHCEHDQPLRWAQVQWPEGKPAEAAYICEDCGAAWSESDRLKGIAKGKWIADRPPCGIIGFHLSELYSPWSTIPLVAQSFVEAQHSYETKKTWVNTVLGETYEEDAAKIDHHILANRGEEWGDVAPDEVLIVTAGVDVQGDRLEIERVGWGLDEESWSLDHTVLWGDPSDPGLWRQLDAYLLQPSMKADGRTLPVRTTCVDSGGHHTQTVYKFCKMRRRRRVFAIKGRAGVSVVWPTSAQIRKTKNTNVIIVGVDAAKDAVYAQLRTEFAGPMYCHFPAGRSPAWFEQLTAEVVQTKYHRGFPTRVYILPEGRRNEALDCRVYAYAALQSLQVRWGTERAAAVGPTVKIPAEIADQALAKTRAAAKSPFLRGGGMRRGSWLK